MTTLAPIHCQKTSTPEGAPSSPGPLGAPHGHGRTPEKRGQQATATGKGKDKGRGKERGEAATRTRPSSPPRVWPARSVEIRPPIFDHHEPERDRRWVPAERSHDPRNKLPEQRASENLTRGVEQVETASRKGEETAGVRVGMRLERLSNETADEGARSDGPAARNSHNDGGDGGVDH